MKCSDIMIIRATQKKMMSLPVTSTSEGRKVSRSVVSSGQPSVANGTSCDENQVSRTSGSWCNGPAYPEAFAMASASSIERATMNVRPSISVPSVCQAGI